MVWLVKHGEKYQAFACGNCAIEFHKVRKDSKPPTENDAWAGPIKQCVEDFK